MSSARQSRAALDAIESGTLRGFQTSRDELRAASRAALDAISA